MNNTVPVMSMVCMAVSAVLSLAIPVLLMLYFRKKKNAELLPLFIGCAVFILFALVLERGVHSLVLGSGTGEKILASPLLYALYGGLMAGLFEECGRFAAFKTVLRGRLGNDANSLMYGAGHGGTEAVLIFGVTMISNIAIAAAINSGNTEVLSALSGAAGEDAAGALISQLIETPSWMFLVGLLERCLAIVLHLSFSVIVWFGAKPHGRLWLLPLAIALHALCDGIAAYAAASGVSTFAVEAVTACCAAVCAIIARGVWRKYSAVSTSPHEA